MYDVGGRGKKRGEEGGKRDLDGPISRFTILMCIGRLYTNVFSSTALVFFPFSSSPLSLMVM